VDIFQFQGLFLLASAIIGYFLHNRLSIRIVTFINTWLNLPLIFLVTYLTRGFEISDVQIFLTSLIYNLSMLFIVLYLTRGIDSFARGSIIINSIFMNTINLPFSLLLVFRGTYDIAATFAVSATIMRLPITIITYSYLSRGNKSNRVNNVSVNTNRSLTQLSRYLPVITFLIGGAMHYVIPNINSILNENVVNTINLVLIIVVLYEFGYQIRRVAGEITIKDITSKPYIIIYVSRLLISPVIIFSTLLALGAFSRRIIEQVMVTAMMAPAITNVVWAKVYGFDTKIVVKSTIVLTPIATLLAIVFLIFY